MRPIEFFEIAIGTPFARVAFIRFEDQSILETSMWAMGAIVWRLPSYYFFDKDSL